MLKKSSLLLLALFAIAVLTAPALALDMHSGQWEITSQVEVPGMPMPMPPVTITQCLSKDKPAPTDAGKNQMNKNCHMHDVKIKGNTVSWTLTCNEKGQQMASQGSITYRGDRFDGVIVTHAIANGQPMNMNTKLTGKRIGTCN